jgi:hypothetical protein
MSEGLRIKSRIHKEDEMGDISVGMDDGVALFNTSHPTDDGHTHIFELECEPLNIYLAGPIRNRPYFNKDAFYDGARFLRSLGHTVFSPIEHTEKLYGKNIYDHSPEGNEEVIGVDPKLVISDDIDYIINQADAIAMLPDWRKSKGARAEHALAIFLNLRIIYLGEAHAEFDAVVADVSGDQVDDRYMTLGIGDGTFHRWKLTDSLLRKVRREINEKLD